jgi:hypothetical protein
MCESAFMVRIVSFPFDLQSAAVFEYMPCHAYATTMPFCKRLRKATAQRSMGAAWVWHV